MNELDPRIVKVGIEVNGVLKTYDGLAVTAHGCKFGNPNQNEVEIKITNLSRETRNYILTETSPFNANRKLKRIILEVGRESYGTFPLFTGDIASVTASHKQSKNTDVKTTNDKSDDKKSKAQISQPPDITISLKALTADFLKGNLISTNQPSQSKLSRIAQQIAKDNNLTLNFQAKDKSISNYAFSGASIRQIDRLGEMGGVDAYIDDNNLVVKDINVPLNGKLRKLDSSSGMIGIPEITEVGVKVKFLIDNQTTLGGALEIVSDLNPAANGTYAIYKLDFEVASRDIPFYFTAEAKRIKT